MADETQTTNLSEHTHPISMPVYEVPKPDVPISGSGLHSILKDFLPATEDEESIKPDGNGKNDDGKGDDPTTTPEETTKTTDPLINVKLEEMTAEQLIEEIKKNQRISNERLNEVNNFKAEMEKIKANGGDPEIKAFIDALREDPRKAWQTYAEKLKLPDPDVVGQIFSSSDDADVRFEHWQNNVLKPQIEQKYKMQEGEFRYDPAEAYTKGTASYDWRIATSVKEDEMRNESRNIQSSRQEQLSKAREQQQQDINWLAKTYFNDDVAKATSMVVELNAIPEKIAKGELTAENHPLALRSLIRGAFFDQLVKTEVDKAVNDLVSQYNSLGMHLPKKETVTNITTVKSKENPSAPKNGQKSFSPLDNLLSGYL